MSPSPAPFESQALMATLDEMPPTSPTACAGWSAHDIAAHLAAGSKEIADLIENKLAGRPERPTRGFAEREAPFAALSSSELRKAMAAEGGRKQAASQALAETDEPSFQFTGRSFNVVQLSTHSRSEAALHRWDVAGDDDISEQLLTQPDLTRHAVDVLNTLPSLFEAPGWRVSGDAIVSTDAANRLLTIRGRCSSERSLDIETDSIRPDIVNAILWPNAVSWPWHEIAQELSLN